MLRDTWRMCGEVHSIRRRRRFYQEIINSSRKRDAILATAEIRKVEHERLAMP